MAPARRTGCAATTRAGEPCGMRPLVGDRFCYSHSPSAARARAISRKKGGQTRGASLRTDTAAPPADGESVSLRDVSSIQALLERAVKDTIAQGNSPNRSRALGYLCGLALETLKVGEMQEQLDALRAEVAEVRGTSPLRRAG